MSEKDVFIDLISWFERHPDLLIEYRNSKSKKKSAKKLLQFRLKQEPQYTYLLPKTLLEKIGISVIPNPKVSGAIEKLAKTLNCKISMAIKF